MFEATLVHAATIHRVSPEQLAFTLRTVHAHEVATAGVIYGCAARLAHAGYTVPAAVPAVDPAVVAERASFRPLEQRRGSMRPRGSRRAPRAA